MVDNRNKNFGTEKKQQQQKNQQQKGGIGSGTGSTNKDQYKKDEGSSWDRNR